jgi:hypothetical protein
MTLHRYKTILLLLSAALLCGCTARPTGVEIVRSSDKIVVPLPDNTPVQRFLGASAQPMPGGPRDPAPTVPIVFRLEVYLVNVPVGTVSRNDAFWKRLDENCVDVPTYDLLGKNGLRCGRARAEEWPSLKQMIEDHPGSVSRLETVGAEMKNIELPMREGVQGQAVCYIGTDGKFGGQRYDRCDNVLNISFCRTPRKVGDIRLAIAPVVRLTKKRLEFTPLNNEQEIEFKTSESIYQNLTVDIPQDNFLIVGPNPDAARDATLLGNRFFMKEGPAEQTEQVLVIAARPFRTDEMPARTGP